jgi:hypothetical protein
MMDNDSKIKNVVVDFPKVHRDKRKFYTEDQVKKLESINVYVNECDDEEIAKGLKQLETPLFCEFYKMFKNSKSNFDKEVK